MDITLEDKWEIQALISRYCWATDTGNGEARAATFVPDGVFEGWIGRLDGRAAIAAQISGTRKNAEAGRWGAPGHLQHWVSNLVIEGTATRAEARCYFVLITGKSDAAALTGMGQYRNDVVKVDGAWLFEKVTVMDWPSADVLARLGQ